MLRQLVYEAYPGGGTSPVKLQSRVPSNPINRHQTSYLVLVSCYRGIQFFAQDHFAPSLRRLIKVQDELNSDRALFRWLKEARGSRNQDLSEGDIGSTLGSASMRPREDLVKLYPRSPLLSPCSFSLSETPALLHPLHLPFN